MSKDMCVYIYIRTYLYIYAYIHIHTYKCRKGALTVIPLGTPGSASTEMTLSLDWFTRGESPSTTAVRLRSSSGGSTPLAVT